MKREILIVDGYNIIGAWEDLRKIKEENLELAREKLIDYLAEYQAVSGREVYIIFDALNVKGDRKVLREKKIKIIFTKEKETADELIELLSKKLRKENNIIFVATSDYLEQNIIFAQGAFRISSRELWIEVEAIKKHVSTKIKGEKPYKPQISLLLDEKNKRIFEKWRRE